MNLLKKRNINVSDTNTIYFSAFRFFSTLITKLRIPRVRILAPIAMNGSADGFPATKTMRLINIIGSPIFASQKWSLPSAFAARDGNR